MPGNETARASTAGRLPAAMAAPPDPSVAAEWTYKRLVAYIVQFERNLDADHEVAGRMVSFGTTVQFHIVDVGYWNPDIITFDGVDQSGNVMKLIQHVSQLNVLLIAARKLQPAAEPRRIGFLLEHKQAGATDAAQPIR
ncbi:MAG: hypothetical protein JNL66_06030 [Alphaproteobacteria bacterium]|nr:hypothetical protein [Alphaproteobacteria bacterium]